MKSRRQRMGLLLALALAVAGCRNARSEFFFALGHEQMGDGAVDEAIASYLKAIELRPGFAEAHGHLFSALDWQPDREKAVQALEKAVELDAEFAPGHLNLGLALKVAGRFDDARASIARAIVLDPDVPRYHTELGAVFHNLGDRERAVERYRHALELDVDDSFAHLNLGDALAADRRYEEAVEAYRRAAQLEPDRLWVHVAFGDALDGTGDYAGAIAVLHPVAANDVWGQVNLGVALAKAGNLDGSISCYRHAIAARPDYALAHSLLGDALVRSGDDLEAAIEAYRRAVELAPSYDMAHIGLGRMLTTRGELGEAERVLERGARIASDRGNRARAYFHLAKAYGANGRVDDEIESLRAATDSNPGYVGYPIALGDALLKHGRRADAIAAYQTALDHHPQSAEAQERLDSARRRARR